MKILVSLALVAASAAGQSIPGTISGPVLGLLFDPTAGAVRPLTGIPAAATLGSPLAWGGDLQYAAVSADGAYAIGQDAESGNFVIASAAGRRQLSSGARAAVSPHGTAAAVCSDTVVHVFTGIPDAPQLSWDAGLTAPPAAVAVSDDGTALVAVQRQGREEAALLYRAGQAPQPLVRKPRIAAVQFIPNSSQVLIADGGELLLSSAISTETLISDPGTLRGGIVAVGASADGTNIVAATSSGRITVIDRTAHSQQTVTCGCTVTALARLRGGAVFRLNEMGTGPIWLLDADAPAARVLFVAAGSGDRQ